MAKLDKEMMKKQHFWLLLIPLFIGLLLAWLGLFFGVADATQERADANDKEKKNIEGAKAQAKKTLQLYDERKEKLFELRTQRWKEMWDLQQAMYVWPSELGDDQVAKVKNLKFGDPISDSSFINVYRDEGMKGYEKLATEAAPIQFAGDWRTALRNVPAWKRNPASEDIWLAAEDYWVQRELVMALAGVNNAAAAFKKPNEFAPNSHPRQKDWKNEPRERTFIGRTWQLDLKLSDKPTGPAIEGSITNLTSRLQPFNATGELVFKVWLSDDQDARPFYLAIEGTSQEGGKTEPIKFVPRKHTISEGRVVELHKVEQVFDVRTVPVKRVDNIALGYKSDRHRQAELQMPAFSTKASEEETTAAAAGAGVGTGMGGLSAPPGLGGSSAGPPPGLGGATAIGGMGTGQPAAADSTYNGLARRRYVNITGQVRAMPVGLLVIADQGFVQDVLTAVANCKLRFQTVQSSLTRFRGSLSYVAQAAGGFPSVGPMGPPGAEERGGGSSLGPPAGGGSSTGPPRPFGPPPGPASGPPGVPPGIPPMGPPGFPPGLGGFYGGGPTSSSDDQTAGNLIEIEVHGIASLYEKFDPNAPKKDEPTGTTPVGTTPMGTAPMGTTPMGTTPMGTTPDKETVPGKDPPKTEPAAPGKEAVPGQEPPKVDPSGTPATAPQVPPKK